MRVLVIEDESKLADYVKRGLSEAGYTVGLQAIGVPSAVAMSTAIAQVRVHALREQAFDQALPAQANGQDQRRILIGARTESVGAALQQ